MFIYMFKVNQIQTVVLVASILKSYLACLFTLFTRYIFLFGCNKLEQC